MGGCSFTLTIFDGNGEGGGCETDADPLVTFLSSCFRLFRFVRFRLPLPIEPQLLYRFRLGGEGVIGTIYSFDKSFVLFNSR